MMANRYDEKVVERMGRGSANIEDQISAALSLLSGLQNQCKSVTRKGPDDRNTERR